MSETNIEWASHTWNCYDWHCTKVSPGCQHCYAETLAKRMGKTFNGAPNWRGKNAIKELLTFPSGAVIFVNSMSDSYHEGATLAMIHAIHNAAAYIRPDVTFLLLTKRPERALALSPHLIYPPNLWVGTSVESQDYLWRLNYLLQIPAAGHFLSAEPLLSALPNLDQYMVAEWEWIQPRVIRDGRMWYSYPATQHLKRYPLRWVIVGAESGADRRPMNLDWVRDIQYQCYHRSVPFMYKQGGAFKPGQNRMLDGQTWDETPFGAVRSDASQPAVVQPALF